MKFKTLFTVAALFAIGLSVPLSAEEDTPLSNAMSDMNKSLRTLKRQLADAAKKDENVALVGKMKKSLEESRKYEPAAIKTVPAAEKAAYLAKYKEQLDGLGKSFDELDAAVKAGKADDAKKVLEKMSEQKETGHKDFAPDEK